MKREGFYHSEESPLDKEPCMGINGYREVEKVGSETKNVSGNETDFITKDWEEDDIKQAKEERG